MRSTSASPASMSTPASRYESWAGSVLGGRVIAEGGGGDAGRRAASWIEGNVGDAVKCIAFARILLSKCRILDLHRPPRRRPATPSPRSRKARSGGGGA